MKTVEVVVAKDGGIKVSAKGFVGADCAKVTKALEEALGSVSDRAFTTDYYKAPTMQHTVKAKG